MKENNSGLKILFYVHFFSVMSSFTYMQTNGNVLLDDNCTQLNT